MARSAEFWDRCLGVFDPGEVLVGQRSQDLYCEREGSPVDDIRVDFSPTVQATHPPIGFFTGHRGSGKSSMLFRLLERFTDDYFVVYFDIEHNLDHHTATQVDLLYLLGAAIFKTAKEESLNPDRVHLEELVKSVYTITEEMKAKDDQALDVAKLIEKIVCFGASILGGKVGEELAKAVFQPFTLTSGVSEEVARKRTIEPQVQAIITNVNLIIADIETKAKKPLLVVVDGLDKLPRFEQAKLVFLDSRALLGPVCRIIYTVPMSIYASPLFRQVEEECHSYLLPNIKLYEKEAEQQRYESGYQVLQEVVTKRLQMTNLQLREVFDSEALEGWLIPKSGGVLREFIGLVHDAIRAAKIMNLEKVNLAAAQKAVQDRAAKLTLRLTTTSVEELREVRKEKRPSGTPASTELLHGLFIVAYQNHRTWFDAHPLLWEELSET